MTPYTAPIAEGERGVGSGRFRAPHTARSGLPRLTSRTTTMDLQPASIIARNPAILFTELDDTVVMMDVDEGKYYELDPVGTRIWFLLDTARPIAEVCDTLVEEYEVTLDVCRCDVLEFVQDARAQGIVDVQPEPVPPS